jgi:hypothetical protein
LTGAGKQVEPKKRSRRFYVILTATILTLAIIIGVIIFEWSNLGQTSYGPGPVDIEVTADKPFYLQGEEVRFLVYVNNQQNWPVPYPLEVAYQIERDGHFVDGVTVNITPPYSIPTFPAQSKTLYSLPCVWNQKEGLGGNQTQVQSGNYTLSVSFSGPVDYGDGGNCTIEIRPTP